MGMLVEILLKGRPLYVRLPAKGYDILDVVACMLEDGCKPSTPEELFNLIPNADVMTGTAIIPVTVGGFWGMPNTEKTRKGVYTIYVPWFDSLPEWPRSHIFNLAKVDENGRKFESGAK